MTAERAARWAERRMGNTGAIAGLDVIDPLNWIGQLVPARRWLVNGLVPMRNVTMLSGDGGIGKSLLAQMLCTAAAISRPWLGVSTAAIKTLGIFCEDEKDELHRRQADINRLYDVDMGDLEHMSLVSRFGMENLMVEFPSAFEQGEPTALTGQIINLALEFGAQFIVLDSLHDLFGGNENSRPQARQFINMLCEIACEIDGAVLLCAHPSKDGLRSGDGTSGNTAWNNAVRSRMYLHHADDDGDDTDNDARVLSTKKANYAGTGKGIDLRWIDGAFVHKSDQGDIIASIEGRVAERVFLELLDKTTASGRTLSDSRNAGNYAPRIFAQSPDRNGLKVRDLTRAMERLFSGGEIIMDASGPGGRSRHIVRAGQSVTS